MQLAADSNCTLNSDVPFSDLHPKKLVYIGSYNFRVRGDIAQPNTSHILHFVKEKMDINEGLEAFYSNSQDDALSTGSYALVHHMGI